MEKEKKNLFRLDSHRRMHFIWYVLIGLVLAIAIALHKKKKSQKPQLALNRFSHPNVADFGPKTGATYLVTGGNGFLGT